MHIGIVGCSHGEVDKIYEVMENIEQQRNIKIDILLCCGDFQSCRNMTDLCCMACPIKYQAMHDFYRYYSGEKKAPVLTLFIGGNHEASNFLQELPHGGWVAPNIFYCGNANVLNFGPLRIAAVSGIYKGHDYLKGRHEKPPYNQSTIRSVYHYRNLDIFRLKQMKKHVDLILSHDWPKGIHSHGDVGELLRIKPFFRKEIQQNELGSKPLMELLTVLQPTYWFSAHLHVKFAAIVPHNSVEKVENVSAGNDSESDGKQDSTNSNEKFTRFLALDKVLPRRQFLQVIEIPTDESINEDELKLKYDPEWLSILKSTNKLVCAKDVTCYMPNHTGMGRYDFSPTPEEIAEVNEIFGGNFDVPLNFTRTAPAYVEGERPQRGTPIMNPQTTELCRKLGISDPLRLVVSDDSNGESEMMDVMGESSCKSQLDITYNDNSYSQMSINPDEITFDDDEDDEDRGGEGDGNDSINIGKLVESKVSSSSSSPFRDSFRSKLVLPAPKNDAPGSISQSPHDILIDDDDEELQSLLALKNQMDDKSRATSNTFRVTDKEDSHPFFVLDSKGDLQLDNEPTKSTIKRKQLDDIDLESEPNQEMDGEGVGQKSKERKSEENSALN